MRTFNLKKKLTALFFKRLFLLISLPCIILIRHIHAEEAVRIVKWKDEKGATHYGDSIPAQYADHENSVINRQGIIIKHNKAVSHEDEILNEAKIVQDKKDKALLSAFTNENEIDLARDRNLQLDQVAIESLQLQKTNVLKRLTENLKYAGNYTKRKKPVPADLSNDIKIDQEVMANQDKQILAHKALMVNTREHFDDNKKRYLILKANAQTNSTLP